MSDEFDQDLDETKPISMDDDEEILGDEPSADGVVPEEEEDEY